jgi:pyruvate-ferredoxin/flavodoxin oxidoreductase
MRTGLSHQQAAVDSGHWILYRYDPRRALKNLNPLQLDSRAPNLSIHSFAETENRFQRLITADSVRADELLHHAQAQATQRYEAYAHRAEPKVNDQDVSDAPVK